MYPSRTFSQILAKRSLYVLNIASLMVAGLFVCPATAYGQAGAPIWTNRFSGLGTTGPTAIAADSSGNVFIVGVSQADSSRNEYTTIKYPSAGAPLWTNLCDIGNSFDLPSLTVDSSGNVFVTGAAMTNLNGNDDYITIKYSSAGTPLWTNYYNGFANGDDEAFAVAADSSGNLFVTGRSFSTNGLFDYDYVTIAYSGAGAALWTNRYNGPGNDDDEALAIAVNGSSNIFATGYSTGTNGYSDYATVAYSNAGEPLWTNRYAVVGASATAQAIAAGSNGNVFVAGRVWTNNVTFDYVTIAYSSAGEPLWTNQYDTSGSVYDDVQGIAGDSSGNVFVTAQAFGTHGTNSSYDYATLAYSGAGEPLWTNLYNGPGNGDDYASALAVDSAGNVFVTGSSLGTNDSNDYATIAYSNAGIPLWTNLYNGPTNANDNAYAIAVDGSGNVYVTGSSSGDYVTIKYASLLGGRSIPLQLQTLGGRIVLSWTNATFSLQSAPTVEGAYTNVTGATSPYTNLITGAQQYFRLKEN